MNHTVNGGTEQHMEAASKWWQQQQADAGTSSGYHIGSDGWRPSSTGNRAAIRKYEDWVAKTTVSEWHFWKSGRLATVRIEKQLYKSSRDQYFYVHVAIKNTSNRIIAVDMKKPHRLIYPNQWTANDQGQRNLVDERRKITQAVDMAIDAELQTAFRSGGLSRIQPGGEISYFVNFNGCDSAKVDREKAKFIVVSMDGQLWLTDGTSTETIAKNADDISSTDFCIPLPIKWRNLPEDATVVM